MADTTESDAVLEASIDVAAATDFHALQALMTSLQRAVASVRINPNQCRVLQRRLQQIYDTLLRMPKHDPTPQLLSTFRACEYTVRKMRQGLWRRVLQQQFCCQGVFECLRSRIKSVWSLHSTCNWDQEDKAALSKDEVWNVDVLLSLFLAENHHRHPSSLGRGGVIPPALASELQRTLESSIGDGDDDRLAAFRVDGDHPQSPLPLSERVMETLRQCALHFYRRRFASKWKVPVDDLDVDPALLRATHLPNEEGNVPTLEELLKESNRWSTWSMFATAPSRPVTPGGENHHLPPHPFRKPQRGEEEDNRHEMYDNNDSCFHVPVLVNSFTNGHHTNTAVGGVATLPVVDNVVVKVEGCDTIPTSENEYHEMIPVEKPTPSDPTLRLAACSSHAVLAPRFRVAYEGLMYRGQKVVVKRLKDEALITPETLEGFVMDVACRVRWSHPNLVGTLGAFCEEFAALLPPSSDDLREGEVRDNNQRVPFMSLGLVMTDLCTPPEHFVTLQRLLYMEGCRFTLLDAIHMTLQAADGLQFALFDSGDVLDEVAECWRCMSPSNIFIMDTRGSVADGAVSQAAPSIAVEALGGHGEDTGIWDPTCALSGVHYHVKYAPPVHIHSGHVSRWTPHPYAVCKEAFALTQLFLAILTNQQPYGSVEYQEELKGLLSGDSRLVGLSVSRHLPVQVQRLCETGLRLTGEGIPAETAGTTATSSSPTAKRASRQMSIKNLQEFRAALYELIPLAKALPQLSADRMRTSFVVEHAVDDYGWIISPPCSSHQ